jgi:hypothetical protein
MANTFAPMQSPMYARASFDPFLLVFFHDVVYLAGQKTQSTWCEPAAENSQSSTHFDQPVYEPIPTENVQNVAPKIFDDLDRLGALGANWDGERALRINLEIVEAVKRLIKSLSLHPMPAVVPLASGGIQLEWRSGQRLVELELESTDSARYLKWDPSKQAGDEDMISPQNLEAVESLLSWLSSSE